MRALLSNQSLIFYTTVSTRGRSVLGIMRSYSRHLLSEAISVTEFCWFDCTDLGFPHPQAIEGFALMVKKTAQTLQSFGTELAETELPNDVEATSNLLTIHTEKKDNMKVR